MNTSVLINMRYITDDAERAAWLRTLEAIQSWPCVNDRV